MAWVGAEWVCRPPKSGVCIPILRRPMPSFNGINPLWRLCASPPRRILAIEKRELPVQLGPVAREHGGFGEEGLAHDGEEFGRVFGGVVIDEGRPAGVDFAAEALVGLF